MPKAAASTKSEHFHSIFSGTDQVPVSRGDLLPPVTKLPVWGKPSGNCSALAEPCIVTEQWLFSSAGTTRKLLGGIFHLIKNGPDFHNSLAKLLAPEVWHRLFFFFKCIISSHSSVFVLIPALTHDSFCAAVEFPPCLSPDLKSCSTLKGRFTVYWSHPAQTGNRISLIWSHGVCKRKQLISNCSLRLSKNMGFATSSYKP